MAGGEEFCQTARFGGGEGTSDKLSPQFHGLITVVINSKYSSFLVKCNP